MLGRRAWAAIAVGIGAVGLLILVLGSVGGPGEAGFGPDRPRPLMEGRPNVVLVIACTLRRDQLSPWGAPRAITPFLAALAESGTVFDDGVAAAPWTRPASTALLTGQFASAVGMVEPEIDVLNRRQLSERATTLAEHLHQAGYETVGITANPNLNRVFGFAQGFDAYREASERWSELGEDEAVKIPAHVIAEEALRLVDRRGRSEAPLFLQVLTLDTHHPIEGIPQRRIRRMSRDGVPPRVGAYRVELQRWDAGVQQLRDGLAARGYTAENTLFVVVSDHGEGLSWPPEHGSGHGNVLMPSTIEMPWVLHGWSVSAGHRVAGVASQVDVLPTLLGMLALDGYEGPGRDWSAQVRGERARTDRDHAFTETYFQRASRAAIYGERTLCAHDFLDLAEQLGIPRRLPRTACFDRSEPGVRTPLPAVEEGMLNALLAWRAEQERAYAAWPDHASIQTADPVHEQLEALGYVEP